MSEISKASIAPGIASLFDAVSKQQYTEAARKAVKNDPFTQAALLAGKNLEGVRYEPGVGHGEPGKDAQRPALPTPRVQLPMDEKPAQDAFTLLMARLIALVGETIVTNTSNRMSILKSMAAASAEGHQQRSTDYAAAVVELQAATQAAGASEAEMIAARAALQAAVAHLSQAQAALDAAEPDSPEYAAALQARNLAQQAVRAAQPAVDRAEVEYARAVSHAHSVALAVERLAMAIQQNLTGPLPGSVGQDMQKQLDANSALILLMMKFADLMGEAAERQMGLQQDVFREMQAARQAYMEQKSVEYQKQVEAAEKMSKIGGCIGKILGGIVMLVGAVVAVAGVVTGGAGAIAGVALFAVGITLTAGDAVVKHFTGVSFMGEAMKPLVNNVIIPAVEWAVKQVTALLRKLQDSGALDFLKLPANFADMAGAIIGTVGALVAMVAVVVAVALVGGAAASKVADKLAGAAGKVVEKMLPRIVEHLVNTSVQTFQEMTKHLSTFLMGTKVQALINAGKIALTAVEVGGAITSAGFSAASGVHREQAAKAIAEAGLAQYISEQMQGLLVQLTERFIESSEQVSRLIEDAFEALKKQQANAVSIAAKI